MHKGTDNQLLIQEVKQKLDWYINEATEAEYDEQAVASLQYILDTMESTPEEIDTEKAWEEFQEYATERNAKDGNELLPKKKKGNIVSCALRHKGMVAAVLLVLIMAVSLGTQAEAIKDEGFFHWIQRVVGGREFVTNPDEIEIEDVELVTKTRYESREEVPEEWKSWSELEQGVMNLEGLAWSHIEILDHTDRGIARSKYFYNDNLIIIGIEKFGNKYLSQKEEFDNISSSDSTVVEDSELYKYQKINEDGSLLYEIEFFTRDSKCYIRGVESNFKIMEELVSRYREEIENKEVFKQN